MVRNLLAVHTSLSHQTVKGTSIYIMGMASRLSKAELCDRYDDLYPGAITDVLDERGYTDQTLDNRIAPLTNDMTVAGIAYPVVGRPNRNLEYDKNIREILRMLGDVPEHAVITYDTNDTQAAHIGELSVTSLVEAGCRGAVIDGGARDVSYILDHDFPVFSRYNTPADAVPRWEILEWGVSTVVGGVEVAPGDVIVGDIDGVVAIPEDIAVDVLKDAEDIVSTENEIREAVRGGSDPLEAYDTYGKF